MLKEVKNGQKALKGWFGQVPESFMKEAFGKFTLDLPTDQAYKKTWASRLNIDKRYFAQWKRATNVAGTVLSIKQSADDISGAWKNIAKQEELLEDKLGELTAMVRDYHNAAGYLKPESHRKRGPVGSITDDQFVQALAKRVTRQVGAMDLHFENDKWELKADDAHNRKCLDDAVQLIQSAGDHPVRVTIDGHTSSPGSVAYNQMLSQKRADAVRKALENRGVKAEIRVNAYGETYPILDAAGNEDQAALRRVVIWGIGTIDPLWMGTPLLPSVPSGNKKWVYC
jgi:outer membrane protein OmpA-like peptidoglycan-associated protein